MEIVRRRVPGANEPLVRRATDFVAGARRLDLDKPPGLAETIDWVSALSALGVSELARREVVLTLGAVAKSPDDRQTLADALDDLTREEPA